MDLINVTREFPDEKACHKFLEKMRWPEGVECLKCHSKNVGSFTTNETERVRFSKRTGEEKTVRVPARHLYECHDCRYQFSATAGTLFHDSHLPLRTWFMAIALITDAKKGMSALQVKRHLGIGGYKTAWYLCHRIREAMVDGPQGLFRGTVEVDATFVGGRFDPRRKRARYDKPAVAGVIQRKTGTEPSKVKAIRVPAEIKAAMVGVIRKNVALEATVMTDEHAAYRLMKPWQHEIVAHSKGEYVRGDVHTNGIENFWSLFKRGVVGRSDRAVAGTSRAEGCKNGKWTGLISRGRAADTACAGPIPAPSFIVPQSMLGLSPQCPSFFFFGTNCGLLLSITGKPQWSFRTSPVPHPLIRKLTSYGLKKPARPSPRH